MGTIDFATTLHRLSTIDWSKGKDIFAGCHSSFDIPRNVLVMFGCLLFPAWIWRKNPRVSAGVLAAMSVPSWAYYVYGVAVEFKFNPAAVWKAYLDSTASAAWFTDFLMLHVLVALWIATYMYRLNRSFVSIFLYAIVGVALLGPMNMSCYFMFYLFNLAEKSKTVTYDGGKLRFMILVWAIIAVWELLDWFPRFWSWVSDLQHCYLLELIPPMLANPATVYIMFSVSVIGWIAMVWTLSTTNKGFLGVGQTFFYWVIYTIPIFHNACVGFAMMLFLQDLTNENVLANLRLVYPQKVKNS